MYQNAGISIEILDSVDRGDTCMLERLHTFMDQYQYYSSLSMCRKLEALVLKYRWNGSYVVAACPFSLLQVSIRMHSTEIWTEALKTAALEHYYWVKVEFPIEEIPNGGKEQNMLDDCGQDNLTLVRRLASILKTQYEPVRTKIYALDAKAIILNNINSVNPVSDELIEAVEETWSQWKENVMSPTELAFNTLADPHIYWKVFTKQIKARDILYADWPWWTGNKMPWTRTPRAVDQIFDLLEIVLDKAREILAPLYEDLWQRQMSANLMTIRNELDPLPSIHHAASSMFRSEWKAREQKIRIRWEATEEDVPDDWD